VARIRSIKPDFWKSEKVSRMTGVDGRQARLLFIALWNFCEDSGCMRAAPAYVRAEVFPYDEDITAQDVARWLDLLEATRLITRYQRPSGSFLMVRGFKDHQKIEKPSKPQLPLPTEEELAGEGSPSHPPSPPPLIGAFPDSSPTPLRLIPVGVEGNGVEGNGVEISADAAPRSLAVALPTPRGPRGAQPSPPDAPAQPTEAGALKAARAARDRKPSAQERFYAHLEELRQAECKKRCLPWVPEGWSPSRINSTLKHLVGLNPEERSALDGAWDAYLDADDGSEKDPPFSIGYFVASLSTWRSRAAREAQP
jgi:hypothetical protein